MRMGAVRIFQLIDLGFDSLNLLFDDSVLLF
jgi:hypothetical protein